jgi:hypothetical protein
VARSYLEVAVYSADGQDKKCVLYQGKIGSGMNGLSDTLILTWDGADPATGARLPKGNYVVRWTVPDGRREYGVVVPQQAGKSDDAKPYLPASRDWSMR